MVKPVTFWGQGNRMTNGGGWEDAAESDAASEKCRALRAARRTDKTLANFPSSRRVTDNVDSARGGRAWTRRHRNFGKAIYEQTNEETAPSACMAAFPG